MSVTLVISLSALLISLASAVAAFGRWMVTYKQIEVQNFLQLSQYLHQTEYRDARHKVRIGKPGELDPEAVRKVCSSFDLAALFVRKRLVNENMFLDYWGSLFAFLNKHLSSDLNRQWFGDLTGRQYYRHFCWLLDRATRDEVKFRAPIQ
jgi:hypothetical protein